MLSLRQANITIPIATLSASAVLLAYAMASNLYGGPVFATSLAALACIFLTARCVAQPMRCHWRALMGVGGAIALAPLALLPFFGFPAIGIIVHLLCGGVLVLRAAAQPRGDGA